MNTITWTVEGMSCGHCKASVEKAVAALEAKAEVFLSEKKVTITYDEAKTTQDALREAIEDQGYDVVQ
ncbi:cation transporter [Paenibacillus marinisediminis]